MRKWLAVDPRGEVRHMELAKLRVTAGLGVQLRDLRWVRVGGRGRSGAEREVWRGGVEGSVEGVTPAATGGLPDSRPLRHASPNSPSAPSHDCRLLDPHLATSYPSAILARERAIVVNLEFIKCIVAQGALRRCSLCIRCRAGFLFSRLTHMLGDAACLWHPACHPFPMVCCRQCLHNQFR